MITETPFDALLARRAELEAQHESLCETCNEEYNPFRGGEVPGTPWRERDRVWTELQGVEAEIDRQCREEERAEATP